MAYIQHNNPFTKSPLRKANDPPGSRPDKENPEEINKVDPVTGGNNAEY